MATNFFLTPKLQLVHVCIEQTNLPTF